MGQAEKEKKAGDGSRRITEDDVKGEAVDLISYVKLGSGAVISKPSFAQFVYLVVSLEDGLALVLKDENKSNMLLFAIIAGGIAVTWLV
nr:hypothetical protein [Tanacetum cinerariifolium]